MAKAFIDILKAVEVEQQQRQAIVLALRGDQGLLEPVGTSPMPGSKADFGPLAVPAVRATMSAVHRNQRYRYRAMDYDPYRPEIIADPYPAYRQLRAEDPVHWSDKLGGWVLTRYDDVKEALHGQRFSADRATPFADHMAAKDEPEIARVGRMLGRWVVFNDPPRHTVLRRLLFEAFSPKMIDGLRGQIAETVDALLDDLTGRDRIDLVGDFAFPLPAIVIAHVLGVPERDLDQFRAWSSDLATLVGNARATPDRYRRGGRALLALTEYFEGVVAERRRQGSEAALVDRLIAARDTDDALNEDELVANCILILFAGHETTTNLIANGMALLLQRPGQMAALRAEPALTAKAIEEMLRFETPAHSVVRIAAEDQTLHGKDIRRGDRVFVMIGAANHDPAMFEQPEHFDIMRKPGRHIAFGYGPHFCIGAHLARVEGRVAFEALLRRLPEMSFAEETLDWIDTLVLRGLRSLPLVRTPLAA